MMNMQRDMPHPFLKIRYRHNSQISLLNKLDYLVNSKEISQVPWLMSHPSSKDRVAEIVKLEKNGIKNFLKKIGKCHLWRLFPTI